MLLPIQLPAISTKDREMADSIHIDRKSPEPNLKNPDHNGNAAKMAQQTASFVNAIGNNPGQLQTLMGALSSLPPAVANAAAAMALNLSQANSSSGSSGHSPGAASADRLLQSPSSTATSSVGVPKACDDEETSPETPPSYTPGKDIILVT